MLEAPPITRWLWYSTDGIQRFFACVIDPECPVQTGQCENDLDPFMDVAEHGDASAFPGTRAAQQGQKRSGVHEGDPT